MSQNRSNLCKWNDLSYLGATSQHIQFPVHALGMSPWFIKI
jgi:hypothetical protein